MGGVCRPGTALICAFPTTCNARLGCTQFCTTDAMCDDGAFCNGVERCASGVCAPGTRPCGAAGCNETTNRCRCASSADCTDGNYCDGPRSFSVESCNMTTRECTALTGVCPAGQYCFESMDRCRSLACTTAADCGAGCWTCAGGSCAGMRCDCDEDRDSFDSTACGGSDCDDADAARYPGNPEVCDTMNRDEDCNLTTFARRDMDLDGFPDARCCNANNCGTDCDDAQSSVHPTAVEVCNEIDDDCDTFVDEGVFARFFRDRDMDGSGDSDCGDAGRLCAPAPGYVSAGGDCDDGNAAIRPGSSTCDPSGTGTRVCRSGAWEPAACLPGTTCRPQPDGTGLCI
jgi:hypothetical protein